MYSQEQPPYLLPYGLYRSPIIVSLCPSVLLCCCDKLPGKSNLRKEGKHSACFPFSLSLLPQPIERCHSHLGQVFLPQLSLETFSQSHQEGCLPSTVAYQVGRAKHHSFPLQHITRHLFQERDTVSLNCIFPSQTHQEVHQGIKSQDLCVKKDVLNHSTG